MWMFDCGEGSQHQILHTSLRLRKLEKLFVTHMHGDHIFGIPGLLASRSFQGGESPLTLYGPPGIQRYVDMSLSLSGTHLPFELDVVEMEDGMTVEDPPLTVHIGQLDHRVPCFGFRVVERDAPGKLLVDKLKAFGVPPGPVYRKVKQGETVQLEDGRIMDGRDFLGPVRRGRIVTVLGDTRRCDRAVTLAKHADVLVHEATYSEAERELARAYFHATAGEAAETAVEAQVSTLILTHVSPRYHEKEDVLLQEARRIFTRSFLAQDGSSFTVSRY